MFLYSLLLFFLHNSISASAVQCVFIHSALCASYVVLTKRRYMYWVESSLCDPTTATPTKHSFCKAYNMQPLHETRPQPQLRQTCHYIRYSCSYTSDSLSNDSSDLCYCVSADHLSNDSIRCIVRFRFIVALFFFYVSRTFSGFFFGNVSGSVCV